MMRIYKLCIRIFICIYIISGILNLCSFDFCSNYISPLASLSSFGTYILFLIITEIEVFLIKDIAHLQLYLLFWVVHLCTIAISLFLPDFALMFFLSFLSPTIGIFRTFTGRQTFIFPIFCFMVAVQLLIILLRNKYANQELKR